jgi:hypothetical protein
MSQISTKTWPPGLDALSGQERAREGKRGQERAREGKRGQERRGHERRGHERRGHEPIGNLGQARDVIDPDDLKALGPVGSIQSCPLCYVRAFIRSTAALAARTPLASVATLDPVTTSAGMVKRYMERERERDIGEMHMEKQQLKHSRESIWRETCKLHVRQR